MSAADCVCVILQALEEDNNSNRTQSNSESITQLQQLQLCLFTSVMALEQPYHLSVAHEDMEKFVQIPGHPSALTKHSRYTRFFFESRSLNYCRIFTELAETYLETMINGCAGGKQHYAIKVLDLVLTCVGHHDYEVAQITFNLWFRLSEVVYQKNCKDLTNVFKPHIERLIGSLCKHCQMEPDHVSSIY